MIMAEDTSRRTPGLANVRISGQTVRRRLRESGLRARRPVVGLILKQRHRTARLAFVRARRRWKLHTVLEAEVLWFGLKFDGRTQLKIMQGTLNTIKYRDDILDPIVLPFLQQRKCDHVFQHDNAGCHVTRVCQDFLNQNHIRVLPWPASSPDLSPIEYVRDELG